MAPTAVAKISRNRWSSACAMFSSREGSRGMGGLAKRHGREW